jgi:DNA-binding winged helix-turn-helix (wHTH) protein
MGDSWGFDGCPVKIRLGEVTFDSESRQLLHGPREIHLSPKGFDLLRMLIEARPRVLTKIELHQRLWPDTFVSDTNLASLIAEIRVALGDSARQPRFIRTAQRVGYAFCGPGQESIETPALGSSRFCWLIKDGRRVALNPGVNFLGRESEDGICLDSHTVSRRHARISVSEGGAVLEDLGSKNGTFVRGESVTQPVALADGDEIRVGSVVLRFRSASDSSTATWSDPKTRPPRT